MKKLMMLFCVALMSVGASAQEYYEEEEEGAKAGDWAIGLNLGMGFGSIPTVVNHDITEGYVNFGLVPKVQYYVTDAFRPEISFSYFIENKRQSFWDINLNFHYLFHMKYGIYIYPIIGATFQHYHYDYAKDSATRAVLEAGGINFKGNDWHFGLNAGAGVQYDITPNLYANLEMKYQYVKDYGRGVLQLGIGYRF